MDCKALLLTNIKKFGTGIIGHILYGRQENSTYTRAGARVI
jgi:hypothetical protein